MSSTNTSTSTKKTSTKRQLESSQEITIPAREEVKQEKDTRLEAKREEGKRSEVKQPEAEDSSMTIIELQLPEFATGPPPPLEPETTNGIHIRDELVPLSINTNYAMTREEMNDWIWSGF